MTKTDLYKTLGMDHFFDGDCFVLEIGSKSIKTELDVFNFLDAVCIDEKLNPLNENWNKLTYDECSQLLLDALNFDLAFPGEENMPREKAIYFQNILLSYINRNECKCFTNLFLNPWKNDQRVKPGMTITHEMSWNALTKSTFDVALVFLDSNKLVFTYKTGED